ncbi:MAG: SprT-like domain-containing protein [Candidatus Eremiobacteraeota bacterium]|nr:SprT-like domain-containing protein [Candidatus Eremiobacteraeota bacterium]
MLPTETDLQLLFAELNNLHFNGEVPACRIRYNARFSNSAGRITYSAKPLLIELSPKHFRANPEALRDTLLHEMIHAWLWDIKRDAGHGAAFKEKMHACGMSSIYHDLGNVRPASESGKRYILRCEQCSLEILRRRIPSSAMSCGRCSKRGYDPRFPLKIVEIVETRELGGTLGRAAMRRR